MENFKLIWGNPTYECWICEPRWGRATMKSWEDMLSSAHYMVCLPYSSVNVNKLKGTDYSTMQ